MIRQGEGSQSDTNDNDLETSRRSSMAMYQTQQESSADPKAMLTTDTYDSSSTLIENSKLDHALYIGSQSTFPANSILNSVGTGYTESAFMGESILTPEQLMQSSLLTSTNKGSVAVTSASNEKRHSTS